MSINASSYDLQCNSACLPQTDASRDSRPVLLPRPAQCNFLGFQDIALNQIAGNLVQENKSKTRFNLWDILFPDRWVEDYRMIEGEDMTPIVVYKSGNRYYSADESGHLAAARDMGKAYILAEVWELPRSTPTRL